MKGVNELFQNIRLLKYFGWGKCNIFYLFIFFFHVNQLPALPDNRWAQDVNKTREVELTWRIKQAIVGMLMLLNIDVSHFVI